MEHEKTNYCQQKRHNHPCTSSNMRTKREICIDFYQNTSSCCETCYKSNPVNYSYKENLLPGFLCNSLKQILEVGSFKHYYYIQSWFIKRRNNVIDMKSCRSKVSFPSLYVIKDFIQ